MRRMGLPLAIGTVLLAAVGCFYPYRRYYYQQPAGLHFCNRTGNTVYVAVGWEYDWDELAGGYDEWAAEGWWTIAPGQCVTPPPVAGVLNGQNADYYYYANDSHGHIWSGDEKFCANPTLPFSTSGGIGDRGCPDGTQDLDFQEINVGSYTSYTYNLNP